MALFGHNRAATPSRSLPWGLGLSNVSAQESSGQKGREPPLYGNGTPVRIRNTAELMSLTVGQHGQAGHDKFFCLSLYGDPFGAGWTKKMAPYPWGPHKYGTGRRSLCACRCGWVAVWLLCTPTHLRARVGGGCGLFSDVCADMHGEIVRGGETHLLLSQGSLC